MSEVSSKATTETTAVRAGETLDWSRLESYLRARLAGIGEPLPHDGMNVAQFPGGHSNLTYLLRFGEREYVMRRPPFGTLPPRAHDMAREYQVLARVHPVFHLAPRPILLCEDAGVIGATFYLMERRRGAIIRAHEPAQVREHTEVRRAISSNIVDALVALHSVDVHAHGLEDLGKPAGFVTRQVAGWAGRWRKAQTEEVAEMEYVARWLNENTPLDATVPTLVHGDFKLDNVMLDERDVTRVVGVFDWEMAAIGDPLVDLGILLSYWTHAAAIPNNTSLAGVTHLDGWFTRDEIVERYAARSGRNVSNIKFYEVFAVFKLAVVAGQIFYRFHRGQTADPRFAHFDQYVSALAKRAVALI